MPGLSHAQKASDPALKPYVELWQNDNVDSLRAVLPSLQKKYSNQPEILFFQSVFEPDGAKANAGYASILNRFPDNVFADECLYRLIQYDYAKGSYRSAQDKADQLKERFSSSRFADKAERMFSGLNDAAAQTVETTPVSDPNISKNSSGKKFRLQVGAFGQSKNAEDLRDKLKSNGYVPVEFSEKVVNDKKLILVWVGAFDSKDEAAKTGDDLKKNLQLNYTIVEK